MLEIGTEETPEIGFSNKSYIFVEKRLLKSSPKEV